MIRKIHQHSWQTWRSKWTANSWVVQATPKQRQTDVPSGMKCRAPTREVPCAQRDESTATAALLTKIIVQSIKIYEKPCAMKKLCHGKKCVATRIMYWIEDCDALCHKRKNVRGNLVQVPNFQGNCTESLLFLLPMTSGANVIFSRKRSEKSNRTKLSGFSLL